MNPITKEWVEKAEGDYTAACVLVRSRKSPIYEAVCFHCQQCVEKYLKARLQEARVRFPKTHDLPQLLKLALTVEPLWEGLLPSLKNLNAYSVAIRYPGDWPSRTETRQALADCRLIRKRIRASLGLPVSPKRKPTTKKRREKTSK